MSRASEETPHKVRLVSAAGRMPSPRRMAIRPRPSVRVRRPETRGISACYTEFTVRPRPVCSTLMARPWPSTSCRFLKADADGRRYSQACMRTRDQGTSPTTYFFLPSLPPHAPAICQHINSAKVGINPGSKDPPYWPGRLLLESWDRLGSL